MVPSPISINIPKSGFSDLSMHGICVAIPPDENRTFANKSLVLSLDNFRSMIRLMTNLNNYFMMNN